MNKKEARYVHAVDRRFQEIACDNQHKQQIIEKIVETTKDGRRFITDGAYQILKLHFGIRKTDFQFDNRLVVFAHVHLQLNELEIRTLIRQAHWNYSKQHINHLNVNDAARYDAMCHYQDIEKGALGK